MRSISAATANREFSRLLKDVRAGEEILITSHGSPVAKIVPVNADERRRQIARKHLLDRLANQPALNLGSFKRDDAYDD